MSSKYNKKSPKEIIASFPKVKEKLNILKETLEDDIEHLKISQDIDARVGHKSVDTSFFGCKTHIAMTKERIITAATVTTGEKNDGKHRHGYDVSSSSGLIGMEMQGALTIFTVNLKRILKLINEK